MAHSQRAASLLDELNSFDARFEVVSTDLPEGTQETDASKSFKCVNIHKAASQVIRVCTAGVFTDIFNL